MLRAMVGNSLFIRVDFRYIGSQIVQISDSGMKINPKPFHNQ
jgi:hypothetical protein